MAGQSGIRAGAVSYRSHRPRPWPSPPPSVGWSVGVRGLVRARPWPVDHGRWTARTPEPGAHGRIADGGGPKSRLEAHSRRSSAYRLEQEEGP